MKLKSECPLCRIPVRKRAMGKNSKLDNIIIIYEKIAKISVINSTPAPTNLQQDKENIVNQITTPMPVTAVEKKPPTYLTKRSRKPIFLIFLIRK